MKHILSILALFFALNSGAAVVTGNVIDATGSAAVVPLRILPDVGMIASGTSVIIGKPIPVTVATNGNFSPDLLPGQYSAEFGTTPVRLVAFIVPGTNGPYTFVSCATLATNLGTFVWTNTVAVGALTNNESRAVTLRSNLTATGIITAGSNVTSSLTLTGAFSPAQMVLGADQELDLIGNLFVEQSATVAGNLTVGAAGRFIGNGAGLTNVGTAGSLTNNEARVVTLNSNLIIKGTFIGNGSGLTNIPDPGTELTNNDTRNVVIAGSITGNGSGVTNVPANGWFLTPAQYGATGDGTTDDTISLQKWIDGAAEAQKTAILPPASGGWYKITSPLVISNVHGIRMVGGGGIFHNPGTTASASQIRQFTSGKACLIITNATGSVSPPDSVHITSVAFFNNVYSTDTNSVGIAIVGGVDDSDNCSINYCLVSGFRRGIVNAGAAILTIQGCGLCYNGDGLYQGPYWGNQSPVLNANYVGGSSITHNYSNAVAAWNGRLTIESTDLVGMAGGDASELWITNAMVRLRNINLEHTSQRPAYVVLSGGNLTVEGGLHQSMGSPGTNTYLVAMTNNISGNNGSVFWNAPSASMVTTDNFSFIEVNLDAYSFFKSVNFTKSRIVFTAANRIHTNFCENGIVAHWPSLSGETPSKTSMFQINRSSTPGAENTVATFGAQFNGASQTIDLTQYYQDGQGTTTNQNLIVKGTLTGNGAGLTNISAGSGTGIFPNTNEYMIYPRDVWIYGPAYGPATNTMNTLRDTSMPGGNFGSDLWKLYQTGGGDGVTYNVPLWVTQVVGTVWFQWFGGTGTSYITNRIRGGQSLTNTYQWPTLTDYGFNLQPGGVTNFTFTANWNVWANSTIQKTLQWHMQTGMLPTNATGNLYWLKAKLWLKGNPQILDN